MKTWFSPEKMLDLFEKVLASKNPEKHEKVVWFFSSHDLSHVDGPAFNPSPSHFWILQG